MLNISFYCIVFALKCSFIAAIIRIAGKLFQLRSNSTPAEEFKDNRIWYALFFPFVFVCFQWYALRFLVASLFGSAQFYVYTHALISRVHRLCCSSSNKKKNTHIDAYNICSHFPLPPITWLIQVCRLHHDWSTASVICRLDPFHVRPPAPAWSGWWVKPLWRRSRHGHSSGNNAIKGLKRARLPTATNLCSILCY